MGQKSTPAELVTLILNVMPTPLPESGEEQRNTSRNPGEGRGKGREGRGGVGRGGERRCGEGRGGERRGGEGRGKEGRGGEYKRYSVKKKEKST